jgi:hypothetical protein
MAFFESMSNTEYTFSDGNLIIKNIFNHFLLDPTIFNDDGLFFTYNIKEGETPEIIADKLYDNPEYAWIILMVNGISDVYTQWPKSYSTLTRYVNKKYGPGNANKIKYYLNNQGIVVHSGWPSYDRIPVTNFEYEELENDKKRHIRLVMSSYVSVIKDALKEQINNG